MPNVEVISLIYKSPSYLKHIYEELNSVSAEGWDVGVRIVANDASPEILQLLDSLDITWSIYKSEDPNEYYLNRVYRCWNYCVQSSYYDNVVLVNSDMMFSKDWLTNLLKHHDGINIPCSRLVESGKMPSGAHGISRNFGQSVHELNKIEWEKYASMARIDEVLLGGLYMPCAFECKRFIESGMYPEGNLYADGKFGSLVGGVQKSGDAAFFELLEQKFGMKHITVADSLVYHVQEGEMDETS